MSFSWTTLNKGTETTKDQMSEVKNNIDTLRSDIGLSPWTWSNIPVVIGNKIKNPEMYELRSALDTTDNQNVCSSDHSTYYDPYCSSQLTNENLAFQGSNICGGYCSIYWAPNYGTIYTNYCTNVNQFMGGCGAVNGTVYSAYQGNYLHWRIN